jgi:hypothetical protein
MLSWQNKPDPGELFEGLYSSYNLYTQLHQSENK